MLPLAPSLALLPLLGVTLMGRHPCSTAPSRELVELNGSSVPSPCSIPGYFGSSALAPFSTGLGRLSGAGWPTLAAALDGTGRCASGSFVLITSTVHSILAPPSWLRSSGPKASAPGVRTQQLAAQGCGAAPSRTSSAPTREDRRGTRKPSGRASLFPRQDTPFAEFLIRFICRGHGNVLGDAHLVLRGIGANAMRDRLLKINKSPAFMGTECTSNPSTLV